MHSAAMGIGSGVGLALIVSGLMGLYLGATVHFTDIVGDDPLLVRAFLYGVLGLAIGSVAAIGPAALSGFLSGLLVLRKL